MSSFISQLLIISALGLMVQTAPISPTKRSTKADLQERVKSAAKVIHNERGESIKKEFTNDNSTAAEVFNLFSAECQNFTIAMTLKHQLLDCIFNTTAQDLCESLSNIVSESLSKILTSLQTMASSFNKMKLNKSNSSCVELTPAQYKMMYKARYNLTDVIRSLDDVTKHY